MPTFFFSVTAFGAAGGALLLAVTLFSSQSAPQQAAGAAMALGLAVIPYVFSRCIQIIASETHRREENAKLVTHLIALEAAITKAAESRPPTRTAVVDEAHVN